MAKDQGIVQTAFRRRGSAPDRPVKTPEAAPMKKRFDWDIPKFLREVQVEGRRVTWTSWKETWITSVMVGIMVIITALFFFGLDWLLRLGMGIILKFANAE